jgi:hypothetical protein
MREVIEHVFGDHSVRFKLFDVPDRLRLVKGGVEVKREFLVSCFLFYSELLLLHWWDKV